MPDWPLVSVLFITYKRVHLLRRSVNSFLEYTDYPNLELVVTDDGSPRWVQTEIHSLPMHKFVISTRNRGTGANTNAGLRACTGEYILSLQDDWECLGPPGYLRDSVELLKEHPGIGMVKFYGLAYPGHALTPLSAMRKPSCVIHQAALCESLARNLYSDTPHLKPRNLVQLLGFYKERCTMEDCERDYQDRFRRQRRLGVALFPQYYNSVFVHIGESESMRTNSPRYQFERMISPIARRLRHRSGTLYTVGKAFYRKAAALLVKEGLLR